MNERIRELIEAAYNACLNEETETAIGYLGYLLDDSIDFSKESTEEDEEYVEIWKPNNEHFGVVRWCNNDLACALELNDIDATQDNVDKLRDICENNHHFTDQMIEAGWETINYLINENEWKWKGEYNYTPSSTSGDYSPSNPWDAPGMSVSDFI